MPTTTNLYDPKAELYKAFPKMQALSKAADATMNDAESRLAKRELAGEDTAYPRAALDDAEWRIKCTSDDEAAKAAVARLRKALLCKHPPNGFTQDDGGSFAPGAKAWFVKLQWSTDQLLAREWPWPLQPAFLDRINDPVLNGPVQLVTYLQDRCWSDVYRCGQDNRKELNEAVSVIARLVMRGGQAGYFSGPGFIPVFERFVRDWQDPETGFFGMTYLTEDSGKIRTNDLSLTFHMVHYVPHLIRWWPRLISTLLDIRRLRYPQGWLELSGMTDHNNYDVVELFYRAWPYMEPFQRITAAQAVDEMLDWCLNHSVSATGEIADPDKGDPIPNSYYFAAAFLDTIGFFDPRKKFWTRKRLPDPTSIRLGMLEQLGKFTSSNTFVAAARARLQPPNADWVAERRAVEGPRLS
jgi:hypothetical protein